jgi:hypothetical protein
MSLRALLTSAACLVSGIVHAAEGQTSLFSIRAIDIGRTGEHIVVYVTTPVAECDSGVFRLYRNQFGLTADGQRFNLSQLQIAKATNTQVSFYSSGTPYCFIANVFWQ